MDSQPIPIILYHLSLASSSRGLPISAATLLPHVHAALSTLLPAQAHLFARFTDVHSAAPGLAFVPEVDVRRMVLVEEVGEEEGGVDDVLEKVMTQPLVDLSEAEDEAEPLPPWRALLFVPPSSSGAGDKTSFHLGLIGHHTLFDGLALLNLTTLLLEHFAASLSAPTPDPAPPTTIPLPPNPTFPPSLDSLVSLKPSLRTLVPVVFNEVLLPLLPAFLRPAPAVAGPKLWVGSGTSTSLPHPRTKRHYTHTLPSSLTVPLLQACKANGTTLTSVLHTLIGRAIHSLSLAFHPQMEVEVRGNTALSLRPPSLLDSASTGGTYVGSFTHIVPAPSPTPSPDPEAIWTDARAHGKALRAPSVRAQAYQTWGMLSYIPSHPTDPTRTGWPAFFLPKTDPEKWEVSFEISNLGRAGAPLPVGLSWAEGGRGVLFSQAAQAMGPAVVVSVIGWEHGLTLGVAWEEGVFSEGDEGRKEVRGLMSVVEGEMRMLVGGEAEGVLGWE